MIIQTPDQAALLRGLAFIVLLAALIVLESLFPRREVAGGWRRRARNIGLIVLSTVLLRLLFPLGAVGFAAAWHEGLLHHVRTSPVFTALASLALFDLAIYWQHRVFHRWPLLWRVHRVHHSDTGFDVTLGVRFHPIEILLSFGFKLLIIAILGIAPEMVAIYELSLLAFSLFTHANIAIAPSVDHALRWILITPDFHRIHHSVYRDELNSNFGNLLSIWDRLFGTSRGTPRDGQIGMTLGLTNFRTERAQRLYALLMQPFV